MLQDVAPNMEVMAAAEGKVLSIKGERLGANPAESDKSATLDTSALGNLLILLAVTDRLVADTLLDAAHADRDPSGRGALPEESVPSRHRRKIAVIDHTRSKK